MCSLEDEAWKDAAGVVDDAQLESANQGQIAAPHSHVMFIEAGVGWHARVRAGSCFCEVCTFRKKGRTGMANQLAVASGVGGLTLPPDNFQTVTACKCVCTGLYPGDMCHVTCEDTFESWNFNLEWIQPRSPRGWRDSLLLLYFW